MDWVKKWLDQCHYQYQWSKPWTAALWICSVHMQLSHTAVGNFWCFQELQGWQWVTSERVFSMAGNIVTPKRASLNPEKVEQLIVIKCNMQLLRQFGRKIVWFHGHCFFISSWIDNKIQGEHCCNCNILLGTILQVNRKSFTFPFSEYLNNWTKSGKLLLLDYSIE